MSYILYGDSKHGAKMIELLLFLGGIYLVVQVLKVVFAGAQAYNITCDEKREPHDWQEKIQPGYETSEIQPVYLQCDKCGCIFGHK